MISASLRRLVQLRAGDRCEYCGLDQQSLPFLRFSVDHIVALQHGGLDDEANLALACLDCNRHKGPNLASIDPETGDRVALFHPRTDRWEVHFRREGPLILGITPVGRATVRLLAFNAAPRQQLRAALIREES